MDNIFSHCKIEDCSPIHLSTKHSSNRSDRSQNRNRNQRYISYYSAMNSPLSYSGNQFSWSPSSSSENSHMGYLKVKIVKGVKLAVRDFCSSDPYVVAKMGHKEQKTSVKNNDLNPVWNEDITFSVADPNLPIMLTVFDQDRFNKDDAMGEAEVDVRPYIDAVKMNLKDYPSGTVITTLEPSRQNCLSEKSHIVWEHGQLAQRMCIRLNNVESGEIELLLQWTDRSGSSGS